MLGVKGGILLLLILTNHESYTVKMCAIAPEGTKWAEYGYKFKDAVEKRSGGRLKVKWYLGGVMGDEPAEVRKIKLGQLQGCGFTLVGLGKIASEVKVLEYPFIFESYEEKDYIIKELMPDFKKIFEDKGFVLVGWLEVGFVKFFSTVKVKDLDELIKLKMWVWQGDEFAVEALNRFGMRSLIPLDITDVLSSLSTGLIEGVYGTCYSTLALQWHTKVKFMSDFDFAYTPAGIVYSKEWFYKLPSELMGIIVEEWEKILPEMTLALREDELNACKVLKEGGIESIHFSESELDRMKKMGERAAEKFIGEMFPASLIEKVKAKKREFESRIKSP